VVTGLLAVATLATAGCDPAVSGGDAAAPGGDTSLVGNGQDAGAGNISVPPGASTSASTGPVDEAEPAAADVTPTLRVEGNKLLDTCGNPFIVRGSETFLGLGIDVDGSRVKVVQGMTAVGVNAVRLIPNINTLPLSEIEQFMATAAAAKVVVFFTPNGGIDWFGREDVKRMFKKYEKWLIIDAYGEAEYDDRDRWQGDVTAAIRQVRSYGYTVPLVVLANRYGRDLPSLFERGPQIVAADPLDNMVLGWQAYWGKGGYYQGEYGMSLAEGIRRSSEQAFPVQIGIDKFADPGAPMDYQGAMVAAQEHKVGWLWWDWYNPFGRTDNLTEDGTAANLTALGDEVIDTHPAGIRNTAKKACGS
jgi:hypothetical protein